MGTVAVVGSVNADYVLSVGQLPRPGETVAGGTLAVHPGGKGANQAHAAARLGAGVTLVGAVGTDQAAADERAALAADGVDTSALAECDGPSGVAVILVDDRGENMIAVAPGANSRLSAEMVTARLAGLLGPGSVVLASLEVPLAAVTAAAAAARRAGATMVINPAPGMPLPAELLAGAILTPNEGELRQVAPEAGDAAAAVASVLAAGAAAVVVTRGNRGAVLYRTGQAAVKVTAPQVSVVDTVGAGDAFNGALGAALSDGIPLMDCLTRAVAAGSLACTGAGARSALPTAAELDAFLRGRRPPS
ncbi:MAG TPA: ribokinase [Streptosporangiaceae bacterium]